MYYAIGPHGAIRNEGSWRKVPDPLKPRIRELNKSFRRIAGTRYIALYVRGSAAVGRVRKGISDLDLVFILRRSLSAIERKKVAEVVRAIADECPELTGVEVMSVLLRRLRTAPGLLQLRVNLQTRSCLVDGRDVVRPLGVAVIGPALSRQLVVDAKRDLRRLLQLLRRGTTPPRWQGTPRTYRFWTIWSMRLFLRTASWAAMAERPKYTTDLRTCVQHAARSRSDRRVLSVALRYSQHPPSRTVAADFLASGLDWLDHRVHYGTNSFR